MESVLSSALHGQETGPASRCNRYTAPSSGFWNSNWLDELWVSLLFEAVLQNYAFLVKVVRMHEAFVSAVAPLGQFLSEHSCKSSAWAWQHPSAPLEMKQSWSHLFRSKGTHFFAVFIFPLVCLTAAVRGFCIGVCDARPRGLLGQQYMCEPFLLDSRVQRGTPLHRVTLNSPELEVIWSSIAKFQAVL